MTRKISNHTLHEYVQIVLDDYLQKIGDQEPKHLYTMVMNEVEKALLEHTWKYAKKNRSLAAKFLGLNRGTLGKKLKSYDIDNND